MAPNKYTIRPVKNDDGTYSGCMNFDPNLLTFGDTKLGKNNMKFTNISYDGKRVVVETPEMDIPAGVVQYPRAEDVGPGDRVSYSLLMSFDGMTERPELQAYKDFLDNIQRQVLEMAHMRSTDLFGKSKSKEVLQDIQSSMVRESDKYAPSSAVGLPFTTDAADVMKPTYTTYDFEKILAGGLAPNGAPKPETVIDDIHAVDTKRGSVKVVFPLSSVWSSQKGFGVSMKAQEVLLRTSDSNNAFAFDIGTKRKCDDDALLEQSDDE